LSAASSWLVKNVINTGSPVYPLGYHVFRHRDPAGYGFTDFVTRERFAEWVTAGVLDRPMLVDSEQELYLVK
jgi:hypothetical protein